MFDLLYGIDATKLISKDNNLNKFIMFNLLKSNNQIIYHTIDNLCSKIFANNNEDFDTNIKYFEVIKEFLVFNLIDKNDSIIQEFLYTSVYLEILLITKFRFHLESCKEFKSYINDDLVI